MPFLVGGVTLMVQTRAGSRRETDAAGRASSPRSSSRRRGSRSASSRSLSLGETGVGKERFAERIHEMSPRPVAPFVRINCAAISEPLLEAELFGNEATHKPGAIEHADGGTAFLNDIAELPHDAAAQAAARARGRAVRRIGSATAAAGRRALRRRRPARISHAEVEAGRFRRDLYFRLAGATFTIPPLRERKDEVLPLAEQFVASAAGPLGRTFVLAEDAKAWLTAHDWPGNIRELRNACERAVLLATGSVIERQHLTIDEPQARARPRSASPTTPPPGHR